MYQINNYLARNSIFLKIKHKIDFVKKLFDYEISGRKQERKRLAKTFASRGCPISLHYGG